jgi:hypothetical protein
MAIVVAAALQLSWFFLFSCSREEVLTMAYRYLQSPMIVRMLLVKTLATATATIPSRSKMLVFDYPLKVLPNNPGSARQ